MLSRGSPFAAGSRLLIGVALAAAAAAAAGAVSFSAPAPRVPAARLGELRTSAARPAPIGAQGVEQVGCGVGSACRAAVAAAAVACAFAVSASGRGAAQKRTSGVARFVIPSNYKTDKDKQRVLRRLEPYGQIPAFTTVKLKEKRIVEEWRKRPKKKASNYARQLMEKQRIRFHYNIMNKQLQKVMITAFKKGVEWPIDNALQQLESRLDNVIWRCGIARTMAQSRHYIKRNHIQWMGANMTGWRTVNLPGIRLKVGDQFRVRRRPSSRKVARIIQGEEGAVVIPDHLSWDEQELYGKYLGVCDRNDFGLHVDERQVIQWYTGQGRYHDDALRRRHIRYFEGTNRVISKAYNGGIPPPTPENILNMKRGHGLNARGRRRPPCLWGRRRPLNNAYKPH